jgi:dynein assembly factor 2
MSSAGKDKDFQLTSEEVDRLKDALKKEEFRKLLVDYAKEISDPENRKRYEEEIAQLERNRGQDVKFLHPKPGFVVKARLIDSKKKIFVNICMNDLIKPPVASPMQTSGKIGHNWSIPYSLSPGREDVDKGGVKCTVYDVVFNPQNFKECDKDPRFRQLMISTALEGLEKQLSIKVDKKALKYPKLEYKGTPSSSVIRRPHPDGPVPPEEQPHLKFPYPSDPKKSSSSDKKAKVKKSKQKHEPVHTVTHRGEVDMGDYTNSRVSSAVKRPKSLVVRVELPGVKSVANVDLEVFERKLELTVDNPKYVLKLPLHYDVDQDNTTAQFDKSKEVLTVTIPVLPSSTPLPSDGDLVSHLSDPTSTEGDFPSPTEGDVPTPTEGDFPSPTVLSASSPPTSAAEVGLQDLTDRDQAQNPSRTRGDGEGMKQFGDKDELETPSTQSTSLPLLPSVLWVCPPYRFRQTQDSIVFVFDVKNVVQGSVVTHFDQHWSHMTFTTFTDGQSYSFYVSSDEGLALNCDKSSVDVTTENIVMVLNKDENCHHLWSSVWVGTSSEDKKVC